ncbi:MAG: hypothetical protein AAFN18_23520 [Cyanobacteria bacterium J06554_6]
MSPSVSVAASLSPDVRKDIGLQALSRITPISHLAEQHQVSRKLGSGLDLDEKVR